MNDPRVHERLCHIGLTDAIEQTLPPLRGDELNHRTRLMRVAEVQREGLALHDGDTLHSARLLPLLRQTLAASNDAIAVGDWVLAHGDEFGQWWAHDRLPPRNQLARRLTDGRDKVTRAVIVSNVDTALLVMGLDHDHSLRRLERFVALVQMAGVTPVVVLSKADCVPDPAPRVAEVQRLLPPQASVVAVNALHPSAADALSPWLQPGRTLVLLGSSGAGKSTLTNTLVGQAVADTGANRSSDSRGRHTTTARTLHLTPSGACIVDTPGLRTLRLDADATAIGSAFSDVAEQAGSCRFRDCRHADEPGCAVRGKVSDERLKNYNKLLREAERDSLTALQRKQQVQQWKARGRLARLRLEAKRG